MGLFSKIRGRLRRSGSQADKYDAMSVPELFQEARDGLWEIEAENRDIDLTEPIRAIDKLLRDQEAKHTVSTAATTTRKPVKTRKNARRQS